MNASVLPVMTASLSTRVFFAVAASPLLVAVACLVLVVLVVQAVRFARRRPKADLLAEWDGLCGFYLPCGLAIGCAVYLGLEISSP